MAPMSEADKTAIFSGFPSLSAEEKELAWLLEESKGFAAKKRMDWDAIYENASCALKQLIAKYKTTPDTNSNSLVTLLVDKARKVEFAQLRDLITAGTTMKPNPPNTVLEVAATTKNAGFDEKPRAGDNATCHIEPTREVTAVIPANPPFTGRRWDFSSQACFRTFFGPPQTTTIGVDDETCVKDDTIHADTVHDETASRIVTTAKRKRELPSQEMVSWNYSHTTTIQVTTTLGLATFGNLTANNPTTPPCRNQPTGSVQDMPELETVLPLNHDSRVAHRAEKPYYNVGDKVMCSVLTKELDGPSSWLPATVVDFHSIDEQDYGLIRTYTLSLSDDTILTGVSELNIVLLQDHELCHNNTLRLRGVNVFTDPSARDPYVRHRGWYETELTGEKRFVSLVDAMRAWDTAHVKAGKRDVLLSELHLPNEWNSKAAPKPDPPRPHSPPPTEADVDECDASKESDDMTMSEEERSYTIDEERTEPILDFASAIPPWDPAMFGRLLPRNNEELLFDVYKELAYLLEMSRLAKGYTSWIFVAQQKMSKELQELYDRKMNTHLFQRNQQLRALIGTKKEVCNAFRVYREKLGKWFRDYNSILPEQKSAHPPVRKESGQNPSNSSTHSPFMIGRDRVRKNSPIAASADPVLAKLPPSPQPSSPRQRRNQQKIALNELRWSTVDLATTMTLQWDINIFGTLVESFGKHMLTPEIQELAFLLEKSRLETGTVSWKFVEEHDKSDDFRHLWEEKAELKSFYGRREASLIGYSTEVRDAFDAYRIMLRNVMVSWLQNQLLPHQPQSNPSACRAHHESQRSVPQTIAATIIDSYTTALKEYHHLSSEVRKQAYMNHYIYQWRGWLASDQTQTKASFMKEQESQLLRVRRDEVTLLKDNISSVYLKGDDDWVRSARTFISLRENQWNGFCQELLRSWTGVVSDTDPGHFEHNQRDLWEYFGSGEQSMMDLHITKKKVRSESLSSPSSGMAA
jgi:hypothetical protein